MNRLSALKPGASKTPRTPKVKTPSKLDDHVERSGIDNEERFIDPTTNVIYHKLKTLGKGGFAKGTVYRVMLFLFYSISIL